VSLFLSFCRTMVILVLVKNLLRYRLQDYESKLRVYNANVRHLLRKRKPNVKAIYKSLKLLHMRSKSSLKRGILSYSRKL
jgi:hypothetical protein